MNHSKHLKPFNALELSSDLLQVVQELGFEALTPIQAQSIPLLLQGKDLIGQAQTGSGKTAAFALPILERITKTLGDKLSQNRELQALVLCPTRELCTQVAREIRKFGRRHAGLQVLILSGGQPLFPQLSALEKGAHIAVGTPGRVLDHVSRKSIDLTHVGVLVLDEADRMLDMGFQDDMEKILKTVPKKRQTIFFSATYPRSIEVMSRAYQHNPVRITVENEQKNTPNIHQVYYETEYETKLKALLWLLQQNQAESALVFCNLKTTVIELAKELSGSGLSTATLHGDLEQTERDRVMAKFRNHSTRILIATDVAARGLDVENLDLIVNYDMPSQASVYVHRIGRTGRAGKRGSAISLVTQREKSKLQAVEKFTGVPIQQKTLAPVAKADLAALKKGIQRDSKMETIFISGGRKDKVRPGDILGALTGDAGKLDAADIGKIEIHDHFSYVAVSKSVAATTLQRLRNGKIKGRKFRIEPVR